MIKIKRVYGKPEKEDGFRVLIDRLWPRGLTKEKVKIDLWLKDLSPSSDLRKWFRHEPEKWPEFKRKYFSELKSKKDSLKLLAEKARNGKVTLVYGSKEERFNNAVALSEYVKKRRF